MIDNENVPHLQEEPPPATTAGDGDGRKPKLGSKNPNPHPIKDTSDASPSQATEPRAGAVLAKKGGSQTSATCHDLIQDLESTPGERRLRKIGRVLTRIKNSLVKHCLITGYCAFERARYAAVPTGRGHEDIEELGIGASDKRVAEESGYTQDTIADNRRIYRNCIGEPLDKISDENLRVAEQRRLVEIAETLTRTALIKCSEVVNSDKAMHMVDDYVKTYGAEALTPSALKRIVGRYKRRFEARNSSQASTAAVSKAVTKTIRLSESGIANLGTIAKHLKMDNESVIECALLFCLEHLEEFETSPEVRNI